MDGVEKQPTILFVAAMIVKKIKKATTARVWKNVKEGDQIVMYLPLKNAYGAVYVKYLVIPQDNSQETVEGLDSINNLANIFERCFEVVQIN
jgi:hypothetical protein